MPFAAIAPDVATAETWTPSRRMQAAAVAERERVERELFRLSARERQLEAELAALRASRDELQHQRDVLSQLAHDAEPTGTPGTAGRQLRALPDTSPLPVNGGTILKGARIRETAVRILAANSQPDAPVHYRDWFELVTAQGFMPTGKDPLATFLTQVGRSPVVQRTTTAGMYMLDLDFPKRARERLTRLGRELSDTQDLSAQSTVDEISAARERRATLTTEMRDVERQLEEALRSLGSAAS